MHHRIQPDGPNRWNARVPVYVTSMSATASPNLEARRRFQTTIPAIDMQDPASMVRLHGNTSPIGAYLFSMIFFPSNLFTNIILDFILVLQRFYHQQSQLREREEREREQQYRYHQQMMQAHVHPQYRAIDVTNYASLPPTSSSPSASDKSENGSHFLRHIPKITQKWNPFKSGTTKQHTEPTNDIYFHSNIPIAKSKNLRSNTLPSQTTSPPYYDNYATPMNSHHQQMPIAPPMNIYSNCNEYGGPAMTYDELPQKQYKNVCGDENGTTRDDHGKFIDGEQRILYFRSLLHCFHCFQWFIF